MAKKHKTVGGVLRCARALIRKGWTQGTYARTKTDRHVAPERKSAVQFCALGAIMHCTEDVELKRRAEQLLYRMLPARYYSVPVFNDQWSTTKEKVLALYDKALGHIK